MADEKDDIDGDEDLETVLKRFEGMEPDGTELFARPVYGNGVMGDVAIGYEDDDDEDDQE